MKASKFSEAQKAFILKQGAEGVMNRLGLSEAPTPEKVEPSWAIRATKSRLKFAAARCAWSSITNMNTLQLGGDHLGRYEDRLHGTDAGRVDQAHGERRR